MAAPSQAGSAPEAPGFEEGTTLPSARAVRAILRFAIALILLTTAAGKFLDLRGFAEILRTYEVWPEWLLMPLALGVPLAELGLAAWLLVGRNLRGGALVSAAMHGVYALWAAITLLRGLELPNCGCFGVFLARPLTWLTVLEDLLVAGGSLGLAFLSRRKP